MADFSKLESDSDLREGSSSNNEIGGSHQTNIQLKSLDDIAHLTKLRSVPQENLSRVLPGKREFPVSTVKMLAGREANLSKRGKFSSGDCRHVLRKYVPVNCPSVVDQMSTKACVSQFSADGSLFVAAFQGSQIRIYDVERGWKVQKDMLARRMRQTITDTALSPDKRHLVYSSMSAIVHIVDVRSSTKESPTNVTEIHEGLDLSSPYKKGYFLGILSLKFSMDGREFIAGGCEEDICVYDLEAKKVSFRFSVESDVNTVCFADESGHLIYSGSDDHFCKVWDRRCVRAKGGLAGVLMGHTDVITCIDSRGDGRYLISNSRDQSIKLWDIRKMSSNSTCNQGYPQQARGLKHPYDQSVTTYEGHSVWRTLIRCYFSPEYSTGHKYIYTGSHDTCVYIYDLVSGAQVAKLEYHKWTVRDCSWHPNYPMLVSSSWDGDLVKWEHPGSGSGSGSGEPTD